MKVAYASATYGPHDFRFLEAISNECEVHHLVVSAEGSSREPRPSGALATHWVQESLFTERVDHIRRLLQEIGPDVVHAGPIQR